VPIDTNRLNAPTDAASAVRGVCKGAVGLGTLLSAHAASVIAASAVMLLLEVLMVLSSQWVARAHHERVTNMRTATPSELPASDVEGRRI